MQRQRASFREGEMLFCRFCWQHVDQMEKKNKETNGLHVLYK